MTVRSMADMAPAEVMNLTGTRDGIQAITDGLIRTAVKTIGNHIKEIRDRVVKAKITIGGNTIRVTRIGIPSAETATPGTITGTKIVRIPEGRIPEGRMTKMSSMALLVIQASTVQRDRETLTSMTVM